MTILVAALYLAASVIVATAADPREDEKALLPWPLWSRVEPCSLPDMFLSETGKRISTVDEWERIRRPEILRWFESNMYGIRPVDRPDGLTFAPIGQDEMRVDCDALCKRVRIGYRGKLGEGGFNVLAYIPTAARKRPVPAFLLICNESLVANLDSGRRVTTGFFPVEQIVRRGYAAVAFCHTDLASDERTPVLTGGVFAVFGPKMRTGTSWGAISAWAWGASRVLDWMEVEPMLDAKHVAVVGHSRCGKTALYAAATDRRFAMACVNDSGCCGAKLNHVSVPMSEDIGLDNVVNPHWFCENFRNWDGRDREIPYDQHELAALIAPRLLAIASASEDIPAGPYGEYLTAKYCSPAWELYGMRGLVADSTTETRRGTKGFPPLDTPVNAGCVSYHLRQGPHLLDYFDWMCYMDFADRHGWRN